MIFDLNALDLRFEGGPGPRGLVKVRAGKVCQQEEAESLTDQAYWEVPSTRSS